MEQRALGQSGIETGPLIFGGNVLGWTADQARSFELLDAFLDAGFSLIDTADVYSRWAPGHQGGESETVIGDWLRRRGGRGGVQVATKVGMMGRLTADNIERSCEASLRRLGIDRIDLYQSHQDDAETPLPETLEAYGRLIRAGKVGAVGASNYAAPRLEAALRAASDGGLPRYESLQPEYNLLERGIERDLLPLCRREGVGVITYFSLAAGFLTGKYRSAADAEGKARGQKVGQYINERGFAVLRALDQIAEAHGTGPAQAALAWVMARPGVTAAIASATSLDQLRDLTEAARLVLTPGEIEALDAASA